MFFLVDEVLCSSGNELQQNSNASSKEQYMYMLQVKVIQVKIF